MANVVGFTPSGYSMYAEVRQDTTGFTGTGEILTVSDNSTNNRGILRITAANQYQALTQSGGISDGASTRASIGAVLAKVCGSFSTNYMYVTVNGNWSSADTTVTMPVGTMTDINIGSGPTEISQTNAYIFRVQLIMKTLTREESSVLTS